MPVTTTPIKQNRTEYQKNYYKKNKEQIIKRTNLNYKNNRASRIKTNQEWTEKNKQSRLWSQAKSRAKIKNIEFSLKQTDIFIPEICPILGVKLTFTQGKGRQKYNLSIDRIDCTKGYTPDNIQIISDLANKMKSHASPEELVLFAEGILKIYKN